MQRTTTHHHLSRAGLFLVALPILFAIGCADLVRRTEAPANRAAGAPLEPNWTLVAGYSTAFDLNQNERSENIRRAAAELDGTRLEPGATWSFNRTVGPRTRARGFRVAPVLEFEGALPALGGGICQVSTTVYNAALLADVTVTRRYPHSRPVSYVQLGRDATVSWGSKDLRLVNPHTFPIRFHARIQHDRLVVEVWAPKRLDYEVQLTTGDAEPASPRKQYQTLEETDRLAVTGVWVKLYRHRLKDGSVFQTEKVGRSSFYPFNIKPEPGQSEAHR